MTEETAEATDRGTGVAGFEPAPVTPRTLTTAIATVATSLVVAGAAVVPMPYAIQSPGPTLDTLGEHEGVPLVTVDGAPTYDASGKLLLTTVSVSGGPGYPVGLLDVVEGWLDGAQAVRPVEEVYPPTETREQIAEENQAAMTSSQQNATVAALEELGYEVPTTLTVDRTMDGSGAEGVVEEDDVLLEVGGAPVGSFSELSAAVDRAQPGDVLTVTVERDGDRVDLEVTTTDDGTGRAILGVLVDPTFDLPVDVEIQIEDVGGPSAGTMFALAIVDLLTEVDEAAGESIAGTGTIDLTGAVGPIGGIRQKMAGAVRDGADWFLAPADNCDDVVGHVPGGLTVVRVETLHEAREAVEAIGAGDGAALRGCS